MDRLAKRMSRVLTLSDEESAGAGPGRGSKRSKTDTFNTEEQTQKGKKSSKPMYQVSSSRSSSTSSMFHMDAEEPITGAGSSAKINHEGGIDDTQVVESKARLIPACWQYHSVFKGKGKQGQLSGIPLSAQRCGGLDACKENNITPTSSSQPRYRLTTTNPEDDLKRWLLTPNDNIFGQTEERTIIFLQNPRFTDQTLLHTLALAITSIQAETAHLDSLIDYVAREPYVHHPNPSWDEGLDPAYLNMSASDSASAERAELEQALMKAVEELELLRGRVAWVCERILGVKEGDAKRGDWVEIAELLRMGAVDEGWVQDQCNV